MMKDYYRILEVHPEASQAMITKAYRVLVRQYHPDTYHTSKKARMEEQMKGLNEAYNTLSDEKLRAQYDKKWQAYLSENPTGKQSARSTNTVNQSPANLNSALKNVAKWFVMAAVFFLALRFLFAGILRALLISPVGKLIVLMGVTFWFFKMRRPRNKPSAE